MTALLITALLLFVLVLGVGWLLVSVCNAPYSNADVKREVKQARARALIENGYPCTIQDLKDARINETYLRRWAREDLMRQYEELEERE